MAFDAFLKIQGIDGESTDEKHVNWIEILSYNWGVSQPQSASRARTGGATGKATFHDFVIVKRLDKASPKLMLTCASGEHLKNVTLEICRAGGDRQPMTTYVLRDVVVTSLQPSGSAQSEELPLEQVSLSYGEIEWKYMRLDPSTGLAAEVVSAGWNVKKNKKL